MTAALPSRLGAALASAFAVHPGGPSTVADAVVADVSETARRRARTLAWAGLLVNLPLFYADDWLSRLNGQWAAEPAFHAGLLAWRVVAVATLGAYLAYERRAPHAPRADRRVSTVLALWFLVLGGAYGSWADVDPAGMPLYAFSLLLVAVLVHPPTALKPLGYALALAAGTAGVVVFTESLHRAVYLASSFGVIACLSLVVDRVTYRQIYRNVASEKLLGRSNASLAAALGELRETQARLVETERQAERLRISRDLHDSVGAQLSNLLAGVELARLEGGGAVMDEVEGDAREAMQQLRETVWALGSEAISAGDLASQLRRFAEARVRHAGLRASVAVTGDAARVLPSAQALHLYRIGQEAIQNAVKHSGGSVVRVAVVAGEAGVELAVSDDGAFRPPVASEGAPSGFGMRTMRDRTEALGGRLTVETNAGTTVRAVVDG